MKKFFTLLVFFVALIVFASCSKSEIQSQDPAPASTAQSEDFHFDGVKVVDVPETKGIALSNKLWGKDATINIKFLNGTDAQIAEVKAVASEWLQYIDLKFNWDATTDADVRISFDQTRNISWSAIGTRCYGITNPAEPTMNLAYSSLLNAELRKGSILRAFGQMLGLELEHRHIDLVSTFNNIEGWYTFYYANVMPWQTFKDFVVDPITDIANVKETEYDENSIMIWGFPLGVIVLNGDYTAPQENRTALSETDKAFIAQLYKSPAVEGHITLSPLEHTSPAEGDTFKMTVNSNKDWTLTHPSWISLSKTTGSGTEEITVTVAGNGGLTTDREGNIEGKTSDGKTSICKVKQILTGTLNLSPSEHTSPAGGDSFKMTVTSNTDWTLTHPSWITLSKTSGSGTAEITVTVANNGGQTTDRTDNIVGKTSDGKITSLCEVTQIRTFTLTISPPEHTSPPEGDTFNVTITSNTDWTITPLPPSWISLSRTSGSGNAVIMVTVAGNGGLTTERTADIIGKTSDGKISSSCNIRQTATKFVTLSPISYNAKPLGDQFTINVTSNTSWTLSYPYWCEVSPSSGTNNGTVTVTVQKNTTPDIRSGPISPIAYKTNECVVNQGLNTDILLSHTSISMPYQGGDFYLDITTSSKWTITTPSWATPGVTSGTGDAKVLIKVDPNPTIKQRGGSIKVTNGTETKECYVSQDGIPTIGGDVEIKIYFRNNWNQSVYINGLYQVKLGGSVVSFWCSGSLPANASRIWLGMGTISYQDLNAKQNLNVGFTSWPGTPLPSYPTTLISSRITGDLSGYFNGSSISGNPAGQFMDANVTWKTAAGVNGKATLEIVYGIGSPGEDWDNIN